MRRGAHGAWWLPQSSKLLRPDSVGSGGFDSHTLPPRVRRLLLLAVLLLSGVPLAAQTPTRAAAAPAGAVQRPPVSPGRAFLQSALIPGLAQARLDRPAGALFFTAEVVAVTMFAKSSYDYRTARRFSRDSTPASYLTDPATGLPVRDEESGELSVATWTSTRYTAGRARARKSHIEDWVALIIFNHLFAGADAFVAAQLWDLPGKVDLRIHPQHTRLGWSVPW